MIDSINVTATGVKRIDSKYLNEKLGIDDWEKFRDEYGNNGYSFSYKTISFEYYYQYKNLVLKTTTHKILDKRDITISDKGEYIQNVMEILKEVLNDTSYTNILLNQIDYCIDVDVGNEKVQEYDNLMNKHRSSYKGKKRKTKYETSIQLTSISGQIIKGYDKKRCIKDKAIEEENKILFSNEDHEIKEKKLQELHERTKKEMELYDRYY